MEYAYVIVKSGGAPERRVTIIGSLTIGRHETNKLVLAETMASRFHCTIDKKDGQYVVNDLKSRNGTLVNGQRVLTQVLKTNDVIGIGDTTVKIVIHQAAGTAATTAKGAAVPVKAPAGGGAIPLAENVAPVEQLDELEVLDEGEMLMEIPDENESPLVRLRRTADGMLNKTFDVPAINLINMRGQVIHGAIDPAAQSNNQLSSETVLMLRLVLLICFRSRASDIHLEPRAADFLLRTRVDGTLVDLTVMSKENGVKFVSLIKILCELDPTQRSIVQEGHFAARAPGTTEDASGVQTIVPNKSRRVDYRVSFVPSLHGQKMVIRIFDAANAPTLMQNLHLPSNVYGELSKELASDAGLILVCGPTGSGKTTTLYSLIRSSGVSTRNIITIEDPVEVQIDGTTQLPINEAEGKTFAALLRSVLRQDPDVIMVGEIRDSETARIALQASMTGHLVFSTLHTRDTVGTIYRLIDLGIEPYMVAQGVHMILAQRLARTLCVKCRRGFTPSAEDRKRLGPGAETVAKIYAPVGCPQCLGTGFTGRRAFFEFLQATPALREQITRNPDPIEIEKSLRATPYDRLLDAGYKLVIEGATSIDEIERAIGR